jgi:hypothetical protein
MNKKPFGDHINSVGLLNGRIGGIVADFFKKKIFNNCPAPPRN